MATVGKSLQDGSKRKRRDGAWVVWMLVWMPIIGCANRYHTECQILEYLQLAPSYASDVSTVQMLRWASSPLTQGDSLQIRLAGHGFTY